jgi:hypothetical protein
VIACLQEIGGFPPLVLDLGLSAIAGAVRRR